MEIQHVVGLSFLLSSLAFYWGTQSRQPIGQLPHYKQYGHFTTQHIHFPWLHHLQEHGFKVFSQTEADGILYYLFANLGTTNKYYVEFGTQGGQETNTRWMREKHNWRGLLMDNEYQDLSINLHQETLTGGNINAVFAKHKVPKEFDFLSIDTDYSTYWLWYHLNDTQFRPRIVMVEFNPCWLEDFGTKSKVVPNQWNKTWDRRGGYYGGSPKAIWELGRSKGYVGVYMDVINWYFVRLDILNLTWSEVDLFFPYSVVYRITEYTVTKLFVAQQCSLKDLFDWRDV
jgi:hypothetical protein